MITAVAHFLDRLGETVCSWTHAWMPSLGSAADATSIRLTAALGLLVAACGIAAVLFVGSGRLLRWLREPWSQTARAGMPSLRVIIATLLVLVCCAPFLWRVATPEAGGDEAIALPARIAAWAAAAVIIIAGGNLLFRVVQSAGTLLGERTRYTVSAWDDVLVETGTRLLLGFIILGTVYVGIAVLANHPVLTEATGHLLALLVIALITWALVNLVHLVDRFLMTRYRANGGDFQARRIATQVVVLKRMAYLVITVFAVSMALMQFEAIRHVGTSILASAGLAGIVLGFAAQKTLANLLAGMQIALTQPLRIDDFVVIDKEAGKIEEITLTYVVLNIWDQRRLIIPLSRIIDNPFENWTRTSTELLGTVQLRCNYNVPVQELRDEAKRFVDNHPLWDKRVFAVQVTDSDHRSIEVRVLVSAAGAGPLFDLRCALREHLLGWLGRQHPEALPRVLFEQPDDHSPVLAGSA